MITFAGPASSAIPGMPLSKIAGRVSRWNRLRFADGPADTLTGRSTTLTELRVLTETPLSAKSGNRGFQTLCHLPGGVRILR
jgi:hypothetical protein